MPRCSRCPSTQRPWTTSPWEGDAMSATAAQAPIGEVMVVRPGDTAAASQVDGWLQDYAASRDPLLRERIILAYLLPPEIVAVEPACHP